MPHKLEGAGVPFPSLSLSLFRASWIFFFLFRLFEKWRPTVFSFPARHSRYYNSLGYQDDNNNALIKAVDLCAFHIVITYRTWLDLERANPRVWRQSLTPRKGNENKLINQGAINTNCKPRTLRQALFKYTDLRYFFFFFFCFFFYCFLFQFYSCDNILRNFNNLSIT